MFDDEKLPTAPRDFVRGIFKGGDDFASLYRRIAYGMPGTPMPSATQLSSQQMVELVHYILSLSDEATRQAAVLTRERIAAVRVPSLPQSADDTAWQQIPTSVVRLTPLWWRNDFDPQREVIQVQAAHDGTTLALRLSWPDATRNADATASEAFEDGVAVALHDAGSEPFLGMGGAEAAVSVWYWDADRQHHPDVFARYERAVVDWYPLQEEPVDTAEFPRSRTGAEHVPPLLAPPRATGNLIVPPPDGNGASELAAGGPGTIRFRPAPQSGVVARGEWNAQRWTVQMSCALDKASGRGSQPWSPPRRLIAAFAVWDGAYRDRDGQKLISIWQDFELRP
jgi:DMSO reductase family type II enzyme heme b subunit